MKRVFLFLLVAGVAVGGSAYTNANTSKKATTYYVNGQTSINSLNDAYTFDETDQSCPSTGSIPCEFQTPGTLSSPQLKSVVDNQVGLTITDRRSSL